MVKESPRVIIDEDVARVVFYALAQAWINRVGVFGRGNNLMPQFSIPEMRDIKKDDLPAFYFFSVLNMRGPIVSEVVFYLHLILYRLNPLIFRPGQLEPQELKSFLKEHISDNAGLRKTATITAWVNNYTFIAEKFNGNILGIFDGVKDFNDAVAHLRLNGNKKEAGVDGMNIKLFSLFVYYMHEWNLVPFFPAPIPVDFHALRILRATEVISFDQEKVLLKAPKRCSEFLIGKVGVEISPEKMVNPIMFWMVDFLPKIGVSHMDLCRATWNLGRELCNRNRQNSLSFRKSKNTSMSDNCFICPIKMYCKFSISGNPYFRARQLVVLGDRQEVDSFFSDEDLLKVFRPPRGKGRTIISAKSFLNKVKMEDLQKSLFDFE
jgi:hypothetical protein